MFVNCPSCRGLVATDPATDEPPERCPRCASRLTGTSTTPVPADDARSGVAAAIAEHVGLPDAVPATDPGRDRAAQPAISIANLLQVEPADARAAEQEPLAPVEPEAELDPEPEPEPALPLAPAQVAPDPELAAEPASSPSARTGASAAAVGRPERRATPSFVRRTTGTSGSPARRWPMATAIAALSLLLGVQWLLADRARLAADRGWRPVVERACALLRCTLPAWHEPAAFTLLERDVRPHPVARDALRVTASFRNDAAWPQAWPEVVLTLSDIDGRPLGMRAFTAAEYLGDAPPSALLASGQGAVIRMDVVEPAPGVVGFAFDFR